jgi:hypothetical protein
MKNIIILTLLLLVNTIAFAQEHNMGGNFNCKLKKGNFFNMEKHPCPACEKNDKKEKDAKNAEIKRRNDKIWADAKAKKEADDKAYRDKIEKENAEAKLKSGNVLINGTTKNSSSSNNSNIKDVEKKKDTTTTYSSNYIPERVLTQKEKELELVQNATNLMNNIANDIEADRLLKEERYKREQERIARNKAYGNELIKNNGYNAVQNGDENAIRKTYLGYMNINDKPTEEGNDKKAMEFLEKIISTHNSNFAKTQLIEDHSRTINYYDSERKKRTTKTILHSSIGGALIASSFLFSDSVLSDEMLGADTGAIVLTGGIVFGVYMLGSALVNYSHISLYSKDSDEYINAEKKRNIIIKNNVNISLTSGYNQRTNNMMIGFNVRF